MPNIKIIQGNNSEVLKTFADNSVDSIVTDPPYGLGKEPDIIEVMKAWAKGGFYEVKAKGGFMGKEWDSFVPQPIFWKEVFRVLKPGGHLICACGTRTQDWMTASLRFAGFEIRDVLTWLYGSGFPKSLDISKAIDNYLGADRKIIGHSKYGAGKSNIKLNNHDIGDTGIGYMDGSKKIFDITEPTTNEAKKYIGWGTNLKPAVEFFTLARKPISEPTIAENILKWGVGALNIDSCRIDFADEQDFKSATFGRGTNIAGGNFVGSTTPSGKINIEANPKGRFPANLLLDETSAEILDKQTGTLTSGNPVGIRKASNNIYGDLGTGIPLTGYGDEGGASRFFYVAKASPYERNKGLENSLGKKRDTTRKHGQAGTDNAFNRGATIIANYHPTVKPVSLMQFLVRLVTPIGGICLDPFNGSGSTGIACKLEGFEYIGIELNKEYCDISEARIAAWKDYLTYDENMTPADPKNALPAGYRQSSLLDDLAL